MNTNEISAEQTAPKLHSVKKSRNSGKIIIYILLGLGAVLMIFPFLWMLLTSFKTNAQAMQVPPTFFPTQWNFDSYAKALESLPFGNLYLNTGLMIVFRVLTSAAFCSMAGFAFAKLKFKGRNLLFSLILIQMMLPSQIFIIPQFQMLASLGLTNTIFALVFPGIVSAFGTFFLRQTYMGIPDELIEAAYLDGANTWQVFTKICFPLTKTALAAISIFTAVFAYTDLMWPLIANTDLNMMTLTSGLSTLNGQFTTNYPVLMAGSLLSMLPMVALYLVFQKQFIEGIAATGGK